MSSLQLVTSSVALDRQQAILDRFELDKLQAIFTVRAILQQYGLERVEVWVANQAKELRDLGLL